MMDICSCHTRVCVTEVYKCLSNANRCVHPWRGQTQRAYVEMLPPANLGILAEPKHIRIETRTGTHLQRCHRCDPDPAHQREQLDQLRGQSARNSRVWQSLPRTSLS